MSGSATTYPAGGDDLLSLMAMEQTVIRLFAGLDHDDAAAVTAAFSAHGVWYHHGHAHVGRSQIAEELGCRPSGRRTVHLVSNFLLLDVAAGRGRAAFDVLTYAGRPRADDGPAALDLPIAVDRYESEFIRDGGAWLVVLLRPERRFAPSR